MFVECLAYVALCLVSRDSVTSSDMQVLLSWHSDLDPNWCWQKNPYFMPGLERYCRVWWSVWGSRGRRTTEGRRGGRPFSFPRKTLTFEFCASLPTMRTRAHTHSLGGSSDRWHWLDWPLGAPGLHFDLLFAFNWSKLVVAPRPPHHIYL